MTPGTASILESNVNVCVPWGNVDRRPQAREFGINHGIVPARRALDYHSSHSRSAPSPRMATEL
jgi:hypothetical protein